MTGSRNMSPGGWWCSSKRKGKKEKKGKKGKKIKNIGPGCGRRRRRWEGSRLSDVVVAVDHYTTRRKRERRPHLFPDAL